jgi:hypothetical protein
LVRALVPMRARKSRGKTGRASSPRPLRRNMSVTQACCG